MPLARRTGVADMPGIPWGDLAGVRVGIVLWGGLALIDVGRLAAAPSYAELGAVALLVTASVVGMRTPTALAAAVVGWLLVDGFVESPRTACSGSTAPPTWRGSACWPASPWPRTRARR